MKKSLSLFFILAMAFAMTACSGKPTVPKLLSEEGIAPYELTESDNYLLQAFGIENDAQILSFHAPKEAITMHVTVYRLKAGGVWESIGGGAISIGAEREPVDQLIGTFTMRLKENYSMEFHINSSGRASYQTEEIILDAQPLVSATGFLTEFQEIELGKELPVALMRYDSGSSFPTGSLQDYFEPSKLAGLDLVQAVTLTFSDEEMSASQ